MTMLKLILLIFVSSFAVALAQERGCVGPVYMECKFYEIDHLTNFYRNGRYFVDSTNERVRIIEETSTDQTRPTEDILTYHRENKMFVIDIKTGKCNKTVPNHSFHRIGVEEGYHYVEDIVIGSFPGDGVQVGVWYRTENSTDVTGTSIAEFTHKDCLPVYEEFEGTVNKEKVHLRRNYFNIVTEIIDPNIFDIPKACL